MRTCRLLALVFMLAMSACGGDDASEGSAEARAAVMTAGDPLATAQDIGVRNAAVPVEGLLTAAQVTEEQVGYLADLGYRNFISLRVATEDGAGWEETAIAGDGASFSRIEVAGAAGLTRENVEALDRALDEAGSEPTVLYCASSNRVGALLALRAYWLDGADAEEALALGREAGLRSLEGPVSELLGQPR